MKFNFSIKLFVEYLRLLLVQWRSLLLLFLEVDSVISRIFDIQFEIPSFIKWFFALMITVWSGFSVYLDIRRKLQDQSSLKFNLEISFSDGNPYNFSLSHEDASKEQKFDRILGKLSVNDANDGARINELPTYMCEIKGVIENDGDVSIRLLDLRATLDFATKQSDVKRVSIFNQVERVDNNLPFVFGIFQLDLSSRIGSQVVFPVRLDPGNLIYFNMFSKINYQAVIDPKGNNVKEDLTSAQVASRIRQIDKNMKTSIAVIGEFEDFEGQKPSQSKKAVLSIAFRPLRLLLINYWERHKMNHLLEVAQEKSKKQSL